MIIFYRSSNSRGHMDSTGPGYRQVFTGRHPIKMGKPSGKSHWFQAYTAPVKKALYRPNQSPFSLAPLETLP